MTVSRPQLHILAIFGAIRVLNLFFMREDGADQFHHGKATNWIGSTVISLSGISLAGLPTFLWVMHLNVGYNNIFLCHGVECVRKQSSYIEAHPILPPSFNSNSVFLLFQCTCPGFSPTFLAREAIELRN